MALYPVTGRDKLDPCCSSRVDAVVQETEGQGQGKGRRNRARLAVGQKQG